LSQSRSGIAVALNNGIASAPGLFIARMDADDEAHPERLERQLAVLMAHPKVAAVGSGYDVIDRAGIARRRERVPIEASEIQAQLPRRNCLAHPTVMMRREMVTAVGGYRAALVPCEDYDLWLRLAERHELLNLPEPLLRYREHAEQATWQALEQRVLCELAAQAAARHRRAGMPDPLQGEACVDRQLLGRLGIPQQAIRAALQQRSVAGAVEAARAGNHRAARTAVELARRHGASTGALRLRCWLMRARWAV